MLALFGQSSGTVPPFEPGRLAKNGVFWTRPSLAHYTSTREELLWRAGDVLGWIGSGTLKLRIDGEVPLRDAAEAHRALEGAGDDGEGAVDSVAARNVGRTLQSDWLTRV